MDREEKSDQKSCARDNNSGEKDEHVRVWSSSTAHNTRGCKPHSSHAIEYDFLVLVLSKAERTARQKCREKNVMYRYSTYHIKIKGTTTRHLYSYTLKSYFYLCTSLKNRDSTISNVAHAYKRNRCFSLSPLFLRRSTSSSLTEYEFTLEQTDDFTRSNYCC